MSTIEEPPGEGPPPRRGRSRVAERLLNQPLRNLGIGVAVVILAATAGFGGLEPAKGPRRLPAVVLGAKTAVAPYDITINKVVWTDQLPNVYPNVKGNRWLALTATVRNTDTTSMYGAVTLAEAVTLNGVDGLVQKPRPGTDRVQPTYLKLLADTSDLDLVQPGLDYDMVFLFEQQGDSTPPEQVQVQFAGHTWRPDSIDKTSKWLDPTVTATATLPITKSQSASASAASSESAESSESAASSASEGAG